MNPDPTGPSMHKSAPGPEAGQGPSPSRAGGSVRNVFSNGTAFLFFALAGFFVSPFVVRSLGNEVYGTWTLLNAMVGYLGLLDLGVRGAVTRFVAKFHGARNHAEAEGFASAALVLFTAASIIAVLGSLGVAYAIGHFSVPTDLVGPARLAVLIGGFTIASALVIGVYGGIVIAMQRFDVSSGTDIVLEALRITILILVLRAGYGLVALALLQLGAGVVRLVLFFMWSRRLYPEIRPSYRIGWDRRRIKEIFGYSLTSTSLHGANVIIFQLDAMVIGWFLPVAQVTFYGIAGTLAHYARSVVSTVSMTIGPRVSSLEGSGAIADARRVPFVAARVATLMLLPIVITFLARGDTFIGLWMGPEYGLPSGSVLFILSLSIIPSAARAVMSTAVMGLNRHRVLILPYASEAVANLVLSVILVGPLGIQGVAWGTTVPGLAVSLGILPFMYSRILETPVSIFWTQIWIRPVLAMLPFAGLSCWMESRSHPASLLVFFAQVALLLPAAVGGAWFWGLDRGERAGLLSQLRPASRSRNR